MKYLFSKDRADRIDDIYSAEDMFAADDMPEGMYDCLESREKKLEEIVMRYRLPPALCWIRRICSVVAVVAAAGLVRGLDTVTLAQAYHNAPAVFWGGGCALAAAGILFAAEKSLVFGWNAARIPESQLNTLKMRRKQWKSITAFPVMPRKWMSWQVPSKMR